MPDHLPSKPNPSEIVFYQTPDGKSRIEVKLFDQTVWLTQKLMAELFQRDVRTINEHIRSIYDEGELVPEATIRKFRIVRTEGSRQVEREVDFYSLDMIIAVGYRVRSHRGTQFRQWATQRLREYIVKGFTLDDERLANPGGLDYFEELLERVRAIRASEKRFYRKVCDIYATSIDYDPAHPMTQDFFATVQNKFHYAITGHTAAELIAARADASKPHMGLTNWPGSARGRAITRADIAVAKSYLAAEELSQLNLIVDQYLSFAEGQARRRIPMHMADWEVKLHAFLELNDRDILTDAGRISAEMAKQIADEQFDGYQTRQRQLEAQADDAEDSLDEQVKRLEARHGPGDKTT
jgi:hypothetical protein